MLLSPFLMQHHTHEPPSKAGRAKAAKAGRPRSVAPYPRPALHLMHPHMFRCNERVTC